MISNNTHLSVSEYMKFAGNYEISDRTIENYRKLYKDIIDKWNNPSDWMKDGDKKIFKNYVYSNIYWYSWSLCRNEKLPLVFIKNENINKSQEVLKAHIVDYKKLEKSILEIMDKYTGSYSKRLFTTILKLCSFLGINDIEKITFADLTKAFQDGLLDKKQLYFMEILMEALGHDDIKLITSKSRNDIIREQKEKNKINCWDKGMESLINEFLDNMESSRVGEQLRNEKETHIKIFGVWLYNNTDNVIIKDLKKVDRSMWLKYISQTVEINGLGKKSKDARITTLIQFFNWLRIKRRDVISDKLIYNKADFKILTGGSSEENLAFEKREHGEIILDYLINKYKSINTEERRIIRNEFCKEAIIISANSGMRFSEIENMEYGSIFFSKDEKIHKMIIKYTDKLGQINRPVYFTKDGYEAVKRVEELRKKSGKLKERYNKRTKSSFVHLFEFDGINPIYKNYMYEFLARIKYILNLVDENGRCVKGNVHAYRHFFGMTVFRLSNYNISVVRFLLGHRSYLMSEKYIEEGNKLVFPEIREERDEQRITGKGIDTVYDLIYGGIANGGRYSRLEKFLSSNKYLGDIVNHKEIKKVHLGYCLNPCGKENKCFKCNNFLATEKEKSELFSFLKDLLGILSFKIEKTKLTIEEAINIPSIASDIEDAIILIEELKNLGLSDLELNNKLNF